MLEHTYPVLEIEITLGGIECVKQRELSLPAGIMEGCVAILVTRRRRRMRRGRRERRRRGRRRRRSRWFLRVARWTAVQPVCGG